MRGARSSVAVALGLVAALAGAAAEDAAPLEATKQELRQLETTRKNKAGAATTDSVKLTTPALEMRTTEGSVFQNWTNQKKKEERQRQQQKADNWLVNGVEQLGKEGETGAPKTPGQAAEPTDANTLAASRDTTDPQYLLKLFDEQKKHSDPKEPTTKVRATPAPDPFAPFLQDWLGTSPVRDQVLDQFKKGGEAGALPVASGGSGDFRPAPVVGSSGSSAALREPAETAKLNPYLVELNAPVPPRDLLAGGAPAASVERILSSGPDPAPAPLTTPLLDALPDARTPAKGPPPGLADDKKYFPQQKKF